MCSFSRKSWVGLLAYLVLDLRILITAVVVSVSQLVARSTPSSGDANKGRTLLAEQEIWDLGFDFFFILLARSVQYSTVQHNRYVRGTSTVASWWLSFFWEEFWVCPTITILNDSLHCWPESSIKATSDPRSKTSLLCSESSRRFETVRMAQVSDDHSPRRDDCKVFSAISR